MLLCLVEYERSASPLKMVLGNFEDPNALIPNYFLLSRANTSEPITPQIEIPRDVLELLQSAKCDAVMIKKWRADEHVPQAKPCLKWIRDVYRN